ncbi:MAG: hypothetical protein HYX66_08925 [Ignavibacteria bacterium]|nr:hypothetical protein [Ignavibacteria bacterium]
MRHPTGGASQPALWVAPDVPQQILDVVNIIHWEVIPSQEVTMRLHELEVFLAGRLALKDPHKIYRGPGGQSIRSGVPQEILDRVSAYDFSGIAKILLNAARTQAINYLKKNNIPLLGD